MLIFSVFFFSTKLYTSCTYRHLVFFEGSHLSLQPFSYTIMIYVFFRQPLSKESQVELIDLVHLMITDGNLKFAQLLRTALVDKVLLVVVMDNHCCHFCFCCCCLDYTLLVTCSPAEPTDDREYSTCSW